ncbi:siderophore-interacting protein [Labrenzia sp. CE80]|uniref:siderophore-interacting protein n=1 Tax=Labrenzia sp. CE80 TaxID=1788986 RepID=UPI00129B0AE9|nr:siderophore-interacting protein [Labrenzia sp. CE80]
MGEEQRYRASAEIDFPRVAEFIDTIAESIATHDVDLEQLDCGYRLTTATGTGHLEASTECLRLSVETSDRSALNRLKYALAGPISFIAASENLEIIWSGDEAEPALPEDLRVLQVTNVNRVTPAMCRVRFSGENLARYDRPDQLHCRLIFQPKGAVSMQWPTLDGRGRVVWPNDISLPTRVYTIRAINSDEGWIEIDFALHEAAGPATQWAMGAGPGDTVGILGPAANGAKPSEFYVLAGDETALPGIARILAGIAPGAKGQAFIEVDGPEEEQQLLCPAGIKIAWLYRLGQAAGTTGLLSEAIRSVSWPSDLTRAFFWGGCEHKAFRDLHHFLRKEVGLPRERMVFYSHWHRKLSEEEIISIGGEAYLP